MNRKQRRNRAAVVGVACALVLLGACGSDDSGSASASSGRSAGSASASDPASTSADASSSSSSAGGGAAAPSAGTVSAETARAQVGDTTYEFEITRCMGILGALTGEGKATDGSGARLTFSLVPAPAGGGEPLDVSSVRIEVGDEMWDADATLRDNLTVDGFEHSEVGEVTVEGKAGQASVTFVNSHLLTGAVPVPGSIELACS